MKQLFAMFLCASMLQLAATPLAPDPAAEVVVYSQPSSSPLHVSTISTNPLDSAVGRAFPSSHTGHRAVCPIPRATTNDVFCAWIGGDTYAPGDPFGTSSGRDHPAICLSTTSPIVNRINPWTGEGDRPTTPLPEMKFWIDTLATFDNARLRILRYSIDGDLCNQIGVTNRIVADFRLDKNNRAFFCESDIFKSLCFDIDEQLIYDISNLDLQTYQLTNVCYIAVVGDGPAYFPYTPRYKEISVTNVTALPIMIERRFEAERTKPTPVGSRTTASGTYFSFRIIGEDPIASEFGTTYTACTIVVMNGSSTIYDSGQMILPHKDELNVYTIRTSQTFSAEGLTWKVILNNSKFRNNNPQYFSDEIPLNN